MKFTRDYSAEIDHLKKEIQTADAIVIGAGAGLSTAAGFTYSGERLQKNFADFVEKYSFGICIREVFIRSRLWKNNGRTGHATFTSTAIWTWTTAHTSACLSL